MRIRRRRRFLRAPEAGASSKSERGRLRCRVGAGGARARGAVLQGCGSGLKTRGVRSGSGREEKVKTLGVPVLRTIVVRVWCGTVTRRT